MESANWKASLFRSGSAVLTVVLLLVLGQMLGLVVDISFADKEEGTKITYETTTQTVEAEYLDVTAEEIPDNIEYISEIKSFVADVENLVPVELLELVEIPIYVRDIGKRCTDVLGCVNNDLSYVELAIYDWQYHAGNRAVLLHELAHVIEPNGKVADGTTYGDAFQRMLAQNPNEPLLHLDWWEDFAIAFERYVETSEKLRVEHPARYAFMRELFGRAYLGGRDGNIRVLDVDSKELDFLKEIDVRMSEELLDYNFYLDKSSRGKSVRGTIFDMRDAFPRSITSVFDYLYVYVIDDVTLCDGRVSCSSAEEGWLLVAAQYPRDAGDDFDLETYQKYYDAKREWMLAYLREAGRSLIVKGGLLDPKGSTYNTDELAKAFAAYVIEPDTLKTDDNALFEFVDTALGALRWNRDELELAPSEYDLEYMQERAASKASSNDLSSEGVDEDTAQAETTEEG